MNEPERAIVLGNIELGFVFEYLVVLSSYPVRRDVKLGVGIDAARHRCLDIASDWDPNDRGGGPRPRNRRVRVPDIALNVGIVVEGDSSSREERLAVPVAHDTVAAR